MPALVIGNLADDACTPSHTRRLFEAIGHPDKEMHEIPGANHYYSGPDQRDTLRQAVGICTDWLHPARVRERPNDVPPARWTASGCIEVGTLISGPFAGRLLGDMGAEVIKIEPPGAPDPLRTWGQAELDGHHFFWTVHARNKKAVTLNLREATGRELFLDLVEKSDIIVENFRPGTLEKWNLGYDVLRERNRGHHPGPGVRLRADRARGAQGRLRLGRRGGQRAAAHERFPRRPAAPAGAVARRQPGRHVRRPGRAGRAVPAHASPAKARWSTPR